MPRLRWNFQKIKSKNPYIDLELPLSIDWGRYDPWVNNTHDDIHQILVCRKLNNEEIYIDAADVKAPSEAEAFVIVRDWLQKKREKND